MMELNTHRHTWKDDIKMDLGETRSEGMDWTEFVQDNILWQTFVNTLLNLAVP